jgi:hypothetical protein
MIVRELIAILQKANPNAEVRCTWESITPRIAGVYVGNENSGVPGVVLLDSDGNFYLNDYSAITLWKEEQHGEG